MSFNRGIVLGALLSVASLGFAIAHTLEGSGTDWAKLQDRLENDILCASSACGNVCIGLPCGPLETVVRNETAREESVATRPVARPEIERPAADGNLVTDRPL